MLAVICCCWWWWRRWWQWSCKEKICLLWKLAWVFSWIWLLCMSISSIWVFREGSILYVAPPEKFFKRREKWKEIMEEKVRSCILLSYFPLAFSAPSASLSFRTTIEEILNRWYWHNFSLFSADALQSQYRTWVHCNNNKLAANSKREKRIISR